MLSLEKIKEFYPQKLQSFEKHILREYLQYKILEIIYNSKFAKDLVFLGGTALRIVYQNQRFSEDLDFDNLKLADKEFEELSEIIKGELMLEGLDVEIKTTSKAAFRCYIKLPQILFDEKISLHTGEKLTIQVDAFSQSYDFNPVIFTLDKFDVYSKIKVVPVETLLSQKIVCAFNRKRRMGRDFFDINYLLSNKKVRPDLEYLKLKMNIKSEKELYVLMKEEFKDINFNKLADDMGFLLMNNSHKERVSNFYKDIIEK